MARQGEQVSLAEANLQYLIEEADRRPPNDGEAARNARDDTRNPRRTGASVNDRQGREP